MYSDRVVIIESRLKKKVLEMMMNKMKGNFKNKITHLSHPLGCGSQSCGARVVAHSTYS